MFNYCGINVEKLCNAILKDTFKQFDKNKLAVWQYQNNDIDTIITNGYFIVKIPSMYFPVDMSKLGKTEHRTLNTLVDSNENNNDLVLISDTKSEKTLSNGTKTHVFRNDGTNENIYIDTEYLKYFDLDVLAIYGTSKKHPIVFKYCGNIVGLCLPIFVNE